MKILAVVVASFLNVFVGSALAHGDHPPTHGGVVGRGNDEVVVEFVMEKGVMTVYVDDEMGKPLATKDLSGTLTLLAPRGPAKEVKLVRSGDHTFTAPGIEPARGDRLRARITLKSGEEIESVALFTK
jgi:hypothetical protein